MTALQSVALDALMGRVARTASLGTLCAASWRACTATMGVCTGSALCVCSKRCRRCGASCILPIRACCSIRSCANCRASVCPTVHSTCRRERTRGRSSSRSMRARRGRARRGTCFPRAVSVCGGLFVLFAGSCLFGRLRQDATLMPVLGIVTDGYKLVLYGEKEGTQRTKKRVLSDISKFGPEELRSVLNGEKKMSELRAGPGLLSFVSLSCSSSF
jgi:hypothetical protein